MAIYRTGTFKVVSTAAAQNLNLGFVPSLFIAEDITLLSTTGNGANVLWDAGMAALATPITKLQTITGGAITQSTLTTTGIKEFQSTDSNLFLPQQAPYTTTTDNRSYIGGSTNLVITGLSNAANASVTATHSFTTSDIGVTVVTFHGVLGMAQINGLSGVIQTVTSTTSFTVNINTTNFSAYVAGTAGLTGGFANVITGAPVNTLYSNTLLPTAEANLGFIGVMLGTGVVGAAQVMNGDVWSYHAWLQSPATGP
jgi:hypothetical protein